MFINRKYDQHSSEIKLCEPNETPVGIADKRILLIFYVRVSMFNFKFDLYGYALNFCVKYNLLFERIKKREDWRIILLRKGDIYINSEGNIKEL